MKDLIKKIYLIQIKCRLKIKKNFIFHNSVIFKKKPIILINSNAFIKIEENCVINSSNKGYHLNMHNAVKLYADKPNSSIIIGANSRINGACIHAYSSIKIGENCLIAANTQIIDANGHETMMDNPDRRINSVDNGKKIEIRDNVWIGANCIILGGSVIGEGSIITAGSVIKGIVPPKCIFGGNPANIIKQY